VVTGNLLGISYHDQVKNFGSVTGGWKKGVYFAILFSPLEPLFRFIDPSFDFPP